MWSMCWPSGIRKRLAFCLSKQCNGELKAQLGCGKMCMPWDEIDVGMALINRRLNPLDKCNDRIHNATHCRT